MWLSNDGLDFMNCSLHRYDVRHFIHGHRARPMRFVGFGTIIREKPCRLANDPG
jgi:hypothetical protein